MLRALRVTHRARRIAWALLCAYALMLLAAGVSTAEGSLGLEAVCSGHGGVRLVVAAGVDGEPLKSLPQDCPLCGAPGLLPHEHAMLPSRAVAARSSPTPGSSRPHRMQAAGAPLPPRGPPART